MKHISEINLQRLLDDNLSLVQKLICKHHLAKCDECAAKLEAVKTQRQQLLSMSIAKDLTRLQEAETAISKTSILRK